MIKIMLNISWWLAVLAMLISLFSCAESEADKKRKTEEYHACVNKGVAYFKEIGSYPTLKAKPNKGKHALIEVQERCKSQPKTAF